MSDLVPPTSVSLSQSFESIHVCLKDLGTLCMRTQPSAHTLQPTADRWFIVRGLFESVSASGSMQREGFLDFTCSDMHLGDEGLRTETAHLIGTIACMRPEQPDVCGCARGPYPIRFRSRRPPASPLSPRFSPFGACTGVREDAV